MKRYLSVIAAVLFSHTVSVADTVRLEDVVNGKYGQRGTSAIYPMKDGEHYTERSGDGKMILKRSYRTGNVIDTLFNTATAKDCPFKTFSGYAFSDDEKKIMLHTDVEMIYRRTFKANYYTFEIMRNKVKPLSENGKQQNAIFSPNGRVVAFVRDNNIFLKKLDYDSESQVTTDGNKNTILNGTPDWVYEEEFSCINSMAWSQDSECLSFIKYNETEVPEYSMAMYEGRCPSYKQYELYPGAYRYKYPVAGAKNSTVGVYTYVLDDMVTKKMNVLLDEDGYIPRIKYIPATNQLVVMTLNRHQNLFKMFTVNPKSGVAKQLLQDESKYWIDPDNMDYVTFYPKFFVFASEKDGYRHLYQYSLTGTLMKQITQGAWDVTAYLGYNAATGSFYYQSAAEGPLYRAVYKVDAKGKVVNLSEKRGTNEAAFSANFNYFINRFSNAETPLLITVNDQKGKVVRTIEDNHALKQELAAIDYSKKEFFTFQNSDGIELNGWIMKPIGFNAGKKYPVVMIQYSGPNSQEVADRWGFGWEQYLTARGYVVASVDGRGTAARGEEFTKCIYMKLGLLESQDQISAAKYLASLDYVDGNNIAIWGWSFGGYTTLMSMTSSKGVFKAGVAIAPVTDWKFYDTIYTERYMRTPQENFEGYAMTSPLRKAGELDGRLLLVSGTADDNVHFQNSLEFSEALVQANKQFDMQFYTNRNHSIYGCNTRLHLYTKVCRFLDRNLKGEN